MKPVLVTVLLLTVISSGLYLSWKKIASTVKPQSTTYEVPLHLQSQKMIVAVGDTVEIDVTLDTSAKAVSAADVKLSFDPITFSGVNFNNGSLFPNEFIIVPGKVQSDGTARIVLGNQPGDTGVKNGVLAALFLKAEKAGVSKIAIAPQTRLSDAEGKLLAGFDESVEITVCEHIDPNNPTACLSNP